MRNLFTLIKFNLLQSIRSKKAFVFIGFYFGILYFLSVGFIKVQDEIYREFSRQGISEQTSEVMMRFVMRFLRTQSDPVINYIFTIPIFNIILFAATMMVTPLIILIIKYDTLSQEIDEKTLRFQLIRTSRTTIYTGKFLSSIIEVGGITLCAVLMAVLLANAQIFDLGLQRTMTFAVYFWLILQVHLLFFIALIQLMSTWIHKDFVLLLSALVIFGLYLVQLWIKNISPLDFQYVRWMFYGPGKELALALTMYTGCALLCYLTGLYIFTKKNI